MVCKVLSVCFIGMCVHERVFNIYWVHSMKRYEILFSYYMLARATSTVGCNSVVTILTCRPFDRVALFLATMPTGDATLERRRNVKKWFSASD